ncbi:MAG: zinc ABC transporter substrate-binding protein [Deltaproteobacteria bacterium]|nr:zinc ABC transporter substrate-binding protein [Deltaproteobacteria bacterium]
MKKFLLLLITLITFPFTVQAKLNVVASIPELAALAQAIGGERITVSSIAKANQDPHFLDARPSFVVSLSRADLLIHVGLGLEVGWLPPLLTQSRNGKIQPGNPGNLDASTGISLLEIGAAQDRSGGDIHPMGNPHYWLDPRNSFIIAQNISQSLSLLDAEGKSYYQERLSTFQTQLKSKLQTWSSQIEKMRGKKIVSYHRSLNYFTAWTGLNVVAYIEPKPGIPPSSKHVTYLQQLIGQEKVTAIFAESFYPHKVPEFLSQKTKVPLIIFSNSNDTQGAEAYFALFEKLLKEMNEAIK